MPPLPIKFLARALWPVLIALPSSAAYAAGEGFFAGASVNGIARNFFMKRDYIGHGSTQDNAQAWTQSFILDARSGYTPGVVGFGMDVLGSYAQKLDGGAGSGGTQLLPVHDRGQADNFGRVSPTLKARLAKSELKIGEWNAVLPILRGDDGRSLPQTFKGIAVTSQDVDDLTLNAGQFRSTRQRNDASLEDLQYLGVRSDRFNYIGGEYRLNQGRTQVGAWHAQLQDIYQQNMLSLTHTEQVADWSLKGYLALFTGCDDGQARAGDLENRTWTGMLTASRAGHAFSLGLQQLNGRSGWFRVTGTNGASLSNDSYAASYDNAGERSWQLKYLYDFSALSVPGLTAMVRYIHGYGVDNGLVDNGSEWGRETELAYTVQSGELKDLTLRWRTSALRREWGSNNSFNETRLIVSLPFTIL
ncbi:OprD family porin [Pseudomonas sp. LRF_L74]|uniref:OprD family porin n=1 Tax=Pseudomonas sp. LRF_L74 TaxID=3369422 RepID=UPI003F64032D